MRNCLITFSCIVYAPPVALNVGLMLKLKKTNLSIKIEYL